LFQLVYVPRLFILLVIDFDDLIFALLNTCPDFRFEMILDKCAADVRIVFEAVKCMQVHRHKTFEQLLITIEKIVIDLNVKTLHYPLALILAIVRGEEVLLRQLIIVTFLFVSRVHGCQVDDTVHLAGLVVGLGPVLELITEHRHAHMQLLVLRLMDLVDALE